MSEYEATHPGFLRQLDDSHEAVNVIARWARKKHSDVFVPKMKRAPTRSVFHAYGDQGDLYIGGNRYEVRGLNVSFTGRHDWPFGRKFIVDTVYAWEKKDPVPYAFYVVNKEKTHCGYLSVRRTRDSWWVEKKFCSNDRTYKDFYVANTNDVEFFNLEET